MVHTRDDRVFNSFNFQDSLQLLGALTIKLIPLIYKHPQFYLIFSGNMLGTRYQWLLKLFNFGPFACSYTIVDYKLE